MGGHCDSASIWVLLLAMDIPADMGRSLRQRARPIHRHGTSLLRPQAHPVCFILLRLLALLAPSSLLLAPRHLWPVPQLQGLSIAWGIWCLLWCSIWKKHPVGNRVPIWVYQRSSICWKHFDSSCLPILDSFPVHSPVDPRLFFYDLFGVEGRSNNSSQALVLKLTKFHAIVCSEHFQSLELDI